MKTAIYVPGLGDHNSYGQPYILRLWRLFGVKVYYFPLIWHSQESFARKQQRLLAKIDELVNAGTAVSLVGVSAGASAVLNAYAKRPDVHKVVCICGKINNPQTIGRRVYQHNPAFKQSMEQLQKSLSGLNASARQNIMSIHPLEDSVVPPKDTVINGTRELEVKTSGHIFSIFYCLLFKNRTICRFIKSS